MIFQNIFCACRTARNTASTNPILIQLPLIAYNRKIGLPLIIMDSHLSNELSQPERQRRFAPIHYISRFRREAAFEAFKAFAMNRILYPPSPPAPSQIGQVFDSVHSAAPPASPSGLRALRQCHSTIINIRHSARPQFLLH